MKVAVPLNGKLLPAFRRRLLSPCWT